MGKGKAKGRLGFRGYGFRDTEEYDKEIFVHASDIRAKIFSPSVKT